RSLDYANSDLAFGMNGRLALQGNFHGLIFYDIEDPSRTSLQTIVTCPGGQGDVSIWGHLAFMSVGSYGRLDCAPPAPNAGGRGGGAGPAAGGTPAAAGAAAQPAPAAGAGAAGAAGAAGGRGAGFGRGTAPPDPARMYGVRIFDITDPRKPRQVAAVQTC